MTRDTNGTIGTTPLLARSLDVDAWLSGVSGLVMAAGSAWLAAWTALPQPLLLGAGLFVIGWSGVLAWMAGRPRLPRAAVAAVIGINVAWVGASVLLALGVGVAANGIGIAFLLLQALVVLAITELQCFALWRSRRAPVRAAHA